MKTCKHPNCNYPVWSAGFCKYHQGSREKKPKKLKPRSDKNLERLAEYRKKARKFLKENPICMIEGCKGKSTLHHAAGRLGDNLTDETTFRNLCWPHHQYYEEHPNEAKKLGISKSRLGD